MKQMIMKMVLASLISAPALEAQDTPPVADTSLASILSVFKGELDEERLHSTRGPKGWCCLAFGFAADVLTQYTGPELGLHRPGGRRSQAELDTFAEQLIAVALTTRRLTGWGDPGDREMGDEVRMAFSAAANPDDPDQIPYAKAYDALFRLYEAGRGYPDNLIDADPERGVRYFLDLAQNRMFTQTEFCQLLAMANPHGRVFANPNGTLSFELGAIYSSSLTRDVYRDVGGERFVINPRSPEAVDKDPTLAPCYHVGLRKRR